MKKDDPAVMRGRNAEARMIRLARSLKEKVPWIAQVRRTGTKHDCAGIDVIVHVRAITKGKPEVLPVALQVKSSRAGARAFYAKHRMAAEIGVTPIVVNDCRSDERVKRDILRAITRGVFTPGRAERIRSFLGKVRSSSCPRWGHSR